MTASGHYNVIFSSTALFEAGRFIFKVGDGVRGPESLNSTYFYYFNY